MVAVPAEVGARLAPTTRSWDERDAILYALGVGARPPADLALLDENGGLSVLPTFALISSWWAVKDLGSVVDKGDRPMVHAFQELELARPLAPQGEVTVQGEVTAVWDKGTNTLVEVTSTGTDDAGVLFTARSGTMVLGLGGWGGERGPSAGGAAPDGPPSASVEDHVRAEQAAIYRLSGDRNPIHIDPTAAQAAGFDDVFLHGLCTLGFAARAVINGLADGDAARLRSISCRFSTPVWLDQGVTTDLWDLGGGQVAFHTTQAGRSALTQGRATIATAA